MDHLKSVQWSGDLERFYFIWIVIMPFWLEISSVVFGRSVHSAIPSGLELQRTYIIYIYNICRILYTVLCGCDLFGPKLNCSHSLIQSTISDKSNQSLFTVSRSVVTEWQQRLLELKLVFSVRVFVL